MSNRDLAAEIQECIAEGQSNPELIAIVLGVSSSEVEAVLDIRSELSPKQILIDGIDKLNGLIEIAYLEYQNFSTNNNASAIRTLQNSRGDLIKQLAEFDDPTANVRTLDVQVLAPFTRSTVLTLSGFIQTTLREMESLVSPDKRGALRELFDRNFRITGLQFRNHYQRAIGAVGEYFAVDLNLEALKSAEEAGRLGKMPGDPAQLTAQDDSKKKKIKRGKNKPKKKRRTSK